jgi:hypothetical protein
MHPKVPRFLRVFLTGDVQLIDSIKRDFNREAEVLCIFDGLASNKHRDWAHFLSIVSPSECVGDPAAEIQRYVPPIRGHQLALLSGLSTRYPLTDHDQYGPPLDPEYGSIQDRMRIAGGNLRILFRRQSLADIKRSFTQDARAIKFVLLPAVYFLGQRLGEDDPFQYVFGCFPECPFTKSGPVGYVSDYIKDILTDAYVKLQNKAEYDEIRRQGNIGHKLLGFSMRNPSVRGFLFEDRCYDKICFKGATHHFEIFDRMKPSNKQTVEASGVEKLESGGLDTIPEDLKRTWLWASDNTSNPGFDAIFCNGVSVYVLQITRGKTHRQCNLNAITSRVSDWLSSNMKCHFVLLTDSRVQLTKYLNGSSVFEDAGAVCDCVAVLCNNVNQPLGLDFPDSVDL